MTETIGTIFVIVGYAVIAGVILRVIWKEWRDGE